MVKLVSLIHEIDLSVLGILPRRKNTYLNK